MYIGSKDAHLYAVDAANGTRLWSFLATGIVTTTPVFASGLVFFGADGIYACKDSTGEQVWHVPTGGHKSWSSFVIHSGVLYAGDMDDRVYALDVLTGKPRYADPTLCWRYAGAMLMLC